MRHHVRYASGGLPTSAVNRPAGVARLTFATRAGPATSTGVPGRRAPHATATALPGAGGLLEVIRPGHEAALGDGVRQALGRAPASDEEWTAREAGRLAA